MKKYKKLIIDFAVPDFLEEEIDKFIEYINDESKSGTLEDCYRTELHLAIRDSGISEENKNILEDYYVKKGIYQGKGYTWKR